MRPGFRAPETLYTTVLRELSQGTRNTMAQVEYLQVYEKAVAVFRATALELRKYMDVLTLEQRQGAQLKALEDHRLSLKGGNRENDSLREEEMAVEALQGQITDAVFFSNRYALCFAGNVGLSMLNSEKADIANLFSFGTEKDKSTDRDDLTRELARVAAGDLKRVVDDKAAHKEQVTDDELKHTLTAILTSWVNQFQWKSWKEMTQRQAIDSVKLRYGNYSLQAGEFKRKFDTVIVDDKFMPITKDDCIGAEGKDSNGESKLGSILWSNFKKLAAYDPQRRKNPHKPAYVAFTYGAPGCGKTFVSHAYVQSLAALCREKGLAMWALTHSTTDYASEYQNKTANELAKLAQQIRDFPGIVVMYVADADNIFVSRKSAHLTAEQQNTLSVYFKMFDGTMIPKNGKFMAVMDANYIDGIDDATKSRLFDQIVEMKRFDKAEDFAEMAKRSIAGGVEGISVGNADWLEIGQYILQTPLSNREIGHVLRDITSGYEVPDELIARPFEEHVAFRQQHLRGITKDTVIGRFDHYMETRAEIDVASAIAKQEQDATRFLEYLAIRKPETAPAGAPPA